MQNPGPTGFISPREGQRYKFNGDVIKLEDKEFSQLGGGGSPESSIPRIQLRSKRTDVTGRASKMESLDVNIFDMKTLRPDEDEEIYFD